MANLQFAYSSAPLKTIQEIQFGLFSPEEVKNMSVVQILYPETMVRSCDSCAKHQARSSSLTYVTG
jgi:DNA-directed RNA polymerase II subunit RPB1